MQDPYPFSAPNEATERRLRALFAAATVNTKVASFPASTLKFDNGIERPATYLKTQAVFSFGDLLFAQIIFAVTPTTTGAATAYSLHPPNPWKVALVVPSANDLTSGNPAPINLENSGQVLFTPATTNPHSLTLQVILVR